MSGSGGDHRGEMSSEERKAFDARLSELDKRLDAASSGPSKPASPVDEGRNHRLLGLGLQMALDLVLGPLVGAGIGWGLDRLLGSSPVLLVIFLCIGMAAGILNLIRTYRQIQAEAGGDIGKDLPAGRDDDDD